MSLKSRIIQVKALRIGRLLLAIERSQGAVYEIDSSGLAGARRVISRNNLGSHCLNFDSLFRRKELELDGIARLRRPIGMLLGC